MNLFSANATEALKVIISNQYVMTNLISRITNIWLECSRIIVDRFHLEAPPSPNSTKKVDKLDDLHLGGRFVLDSRELQLTAEAIRGDIPIRGLVFRECLFNSLPDNLCQEAKRDLAYDFSRQYLKKGDRSRWMSLWRTIPLRRVQVNLVYKSLDLMNWIRSLGGSGELDSIIHEFVCMFRYGKSLDFQEYIEYMMQRVQNIVVPLSQSEVKILDVLMKNRDASYKDVSEITGLSETWVCTKMNYMKRKYVLIEHMTVPFSIIGIKLFHVLLAGPSWSNLSKLLTNCPFLYEIRSILNGPWHSMAQLAVPDNSENVHSLKRMISILENHGIACDLAETFSAGASNSFYHYNVNTHSWEIPWIAMQGWGHRIKEESIDQLIEQIDYPAKTTDYYIDSLDIRILELIRHGRISTRALRKELAIGQNRLLTHLKKLKREGLIRRDWGVFNIGLVERVALRATDKRTASLLDAWSRELPRVYLRYEKNRNLLMIVELPLGDSTRLMDTLQQLKWPVTISPLSSAIWGHWQFPKQYWDVEHQRWMVQKEELDIWLNSLTEECENLVSKEIESEVASLKP